MAAPNVTIDQYPHAAPSLADYTSMMLQMYSESLYRSAKAQILDLGPICAENIIFFAQRINRFHVCDMFFQLSRNRRKGWPGSKVWRHLDYAPHRFDGINLWDFIDHLKADEIAKLADLCYAFLKPKGMITLTSFEEQWTPLQIHTFVIKTSYQVTFRLQNHLDLPWYYYSNRIIIDMFSKFRTVKSFIYQNGVREFLFSRV